MKNLKEIAGKEIKIDTKYINFISDKLDLVFCNLDKTYTAKELYCIKNNIAYYDCFVPANFINETTSYSHTPEFNEIKFNNRLFIDIAGNVFIEVKKEFNKDRNCFEFFEI